MVRVLDPDDRKGYTIQPITSSMPDWTLLHRHHSRIEFYRVVHDDHDFRAAKLLLGCTISNVVVEGPGHGRAWMDCRKTSRCWSREIPFPKKTRSVIGVRKCSYEFLLRSSSLVIVIVSTFASDALSKVAHSVFLEAREARQGVRRLEEAKKPPPHSALAPRRENSKSCRSKWHGLIDVVAVKEKVIVSFRRCRR
jgi:hypothetical protein